MSEGVKLRSPSSFDCEQQAKPRDVVGTSIFTAAWMEKVVVVERVRTV